MKYFTKRQKVQDERIEGLQNKIFREVYFLILAISVLSIVFKTYAYGYDFKLIVTELIIIVIPAVYYGIRTIWLGIYWDEIEIEERTSRIPVALKNVLFGIGVGVLIGIFFGIRSALLYGDDGTRLYYFFLVFSASLMIYAPFFILVLLVPYLMAKRLGKKRDDCRDE